MKKLLIAAIVLFLLFTVAGNFFHDFSQPVKVEEVVHETVPGSELLEGSWHSEDEELLIHDNTIEITGYYEHEGQSLAGVVELATITEIDEDAGTFTCVLNNTELEGYLKDDGTLVIGNIDYTR